MTSLLDDLPSSGLLVGPHGVVRGPPLPLYVPPRSTAPPPGQVVQNDTVNVLIRALARRKDKEGGGKRGADAAAAAERAAKRAALAADSGPLTPAAVKAMTMDVLKAHLGALPSLLAAACCCYRSRVAFVHSKKQAEADRQEGRARRPPARKPPARLSGTTSSHAPLAAQAAQWLTRHLTGR